MPHKFSFHLSGSSGSQYLPDKLVIGRRETESREQVLLRLLGFLLFLRERLQIGVNLHQDAIPFVADLVQTDFQLRPIFWAECGEVDARKLDKLAVKVPEAEIWILRDNYEEAEALLLAMDKAKLRTQRYRLLAFPADFVAELLAQLKPRNQVFWVGADWQTSEIRLDFNELWFEGEFRTWTF